MKVISWNCRGIANRRVRCHVKELLNTTKVDALCLLEIRSPKADNMISYVRPNMLAKCRFWEDCESFGRSLQAPWIVMGDLNDIAAVGEQWGSDSVNSNGLQRFVDAYSRCGLIDPGYSGSTFTWYRFAGGRVIQMRRLDRVLWNLSAQHAFPESKVRVLPRLHSDHSPILFIGHAGRPPDKHLRSVRFEAAWLTRSDYGEVWKKVTSHGVQNIETIIATVTKDNICWNKKVFGNIFSRKRHIENMI
ncbi:PREDICTED: uncharacterized protein LOC109158760 [Ipomoea nil]|uniref:uncharacterized protein LOC109158760 n=1 Tax=Ipomoea nil TaxID=35883 RepID=UPI00090155F0|nr:PREDICTED: uncharacterized protein LOC109158760 [Ipomoea nil]